MDKKNFLFVSSDALHIDCARRVVSEGHEVRYYIENVEDNDIGNGFVPKSPFLGSQISRDRLDLLLTTTRICTKARISPRTFATAVANCSAATDFAIATT